MATMESMPPDTRAFVQMYKWHRIDPVPWAPPTSALGESRVGLVVAACMVAPGQEPFDAEKPGNDPSLRVILSETDPHTLVNTFPGQGFDHAGLEADPNLLVPLDRLHEMADAGVIAEVAPRTVSLCGHLPKPEGLIEDTAPQIARMFAEDGVDLALLVPA